MIPDINFNFDTIIENELESIDYSTETYNIDFESGRAIGKVDGLAAIKQSVIKILKTERFANSIYSDNYGIEFERFIGTNIDFIKSDLERTITDALSIDTRILSISNFKISEQKNTTLEFSYLINTMYGTLNMQGGINI